MTEDYRAFGLSIRTDFALHCPREARQQRPDVRLHEASPSAFSRARDAVPSSRRRGWFIHWRLPDGHRYLRWKDLFEFIISPNGRRISYRRLNDATDDSLAVYLLGQVLSFSLVARGAEPLHGTVLVVEGQAMALLGDCGRGKSTLGAAMLSRGCRLLSDDVVVIEKRDDRWAVLPGVPRIKLFPNVARRFLPRITSGTPMNSKTSKLVLALPAAQTQSRPVSLRAIYVLDEPRAARSGRRPGTHVEHLSGQEAFFEVIRGAFNLQVNERARLANQFDFAARLVASVPIRRLSYPRRLSALGAVCDTLVKDLCALPSQGYGS